MSQLVSPIDYRMNGIIAGMVTSPSRVAELADACEKTQGFDVVFPFVLPVGGELRLSKQLENGFAFLASSIAISFEGPETAPPLVGLSDATSGRQFFGGFSGPAGRELPDVYGSSVSIAGPGGSGMRWSEPGFIKAYFAPSHQIGVAIKAHATQAATLKATLILTGWKMEVR